MQTDYLITTVGLGIALFVTLICIILLIDDKKRKKRYDYDPTDWMFKDFNVKLYDIIFHTEPDEKADQEKTERIGKQLGMNMSDYYEYVYISGSTVSIKNIIMNRVYGFLLMLLAALLMSVNYVLASVLLAVGYLLSYYLQSKLKKDAIRKKTLIEDQLPRFVDLLKPALKLQMPVDQAIKMTARNIDCELSRELLAAIEKTSMTSASWPVAFEEIAQKYQVDILNDFVTNVVTAFNNGVDIYDTVSRQSESMKKTHHADLLSRAKKLDTAILAPIAIFKLIPIIVLVAYPALMMATNMV